MLVVDDLLLPSSRLRGRPGDREYELCRTIRLSLVNRDKICLREPDEKSELMLLGGSTAFGPWSADNCNAVQGHEHAMQAEGSQVDHLVADKPHFDWRRT